MKTWILILAFVMGCLHMEARADEAPLKFSKHVTQLHVGVLSPTGIFGLSHDYTLTDHHSLVAGVGVDPVGVVFSLGYRYHDDIMSLHKTGTFLDKCFFLFNCESRPYVGLHLSRTMGSTWDMKSEDYGDRQYKVSGTTLANAEFGFQTLFSSGIVTSLGFNYRTPMALAKITQQSGLARVEDESTIRNWHQGLGFSLGVGYNY